VLKPGRIQAMPAERVGCQSGGMQGGECRQWSFHCQARQRRRRRIGSQPEGKGENRAHGRVSLSLLGVIQQRRSCLALHPIFLLRARRHSVNTPDSETKKGRTPASSPPCPCYLRDYRAETCGFAHVAPSVGACNQRRSPEFNAQTVLLPERFRVDCAFGGGDDAVTTFRSLPYAG
jgi:hypothetical protein